MHIATFIWSLLIAVVTYVTKDMCCHWCVTKDMSLMWWMTKCHWCDERHALSLHALSLLLAKRHLSSMMWRKACVATAQFNSTQNGFYALGKARMRSAPPSISAISWTLALKQFRRTDDSPLSSFQRRSSSVPLSMPLSSSRPMVSCPWLCVRW